VDREIIRKRKLTTSSHETIDNITILNIGKRTWASQFLNSTGMYHDLGNTYLNLILYNNILITRFVLNSP